MKALVYAVSEGREVDTTTGPGPVGTPVSDVACTWPSPIWLAAFTVMVVSWARAAVARAMARSVVYMLKMLIL